MESGNQTEDLMKLLIYTQPLYQPIQAELEKLSPDQKQSLLIGDKVDITFSDRMKNGLLTILKANLSTYGTFIFAYYFHPDQYYVLEKAWKDRMDLGVIAKIQDEKAKMAEISKHLTFKSESDKTFFMTTLQELANTQETGLKGYLELIKAWAKDPTTEKLAAFAALTIMTAHSILRTLEFGDLTNPVAGGISTLFGAVRGLFSPQTMAKLANSEEALLGESLKFLFEGSPMPKSWLRVNMEYLKNWGKDVGRFFKDFSNNIRKPETLKTIKTGFLQAVVFANWAFMIGSCFENISTMNFLSQAREGLEAKNNEMDKIKKELTDIKNNISDPLDPANQVKIATALSQLNDISQRLQQINEWILQNIAEAETRKQTQEITAIVGGILAVGGAAAGINLGGAFKVAGIVGLVVGGCMVGWSIYNIFELKSLIQDLNAAKAKLDDLFKQTKDLINELLDSIKQVDEGLVHKVVVA